jgi:hypothetical protein
VLLSSFNAYRRVDAQPSDKPLTFDLVADPGRTVQGTLVGPDGKPVTGATGFGLLPRYTPEYGDTRRGEKVLTSEAFASVCMHWKDTCTLSFVHEGRKLMGYSVVGEKDTGPFTVLMKPWGTVTGRLVDAEGTPLAKVRVELRYPPLPAPGIRPRSQTFETDAAGRFRVDGLAPGLGHELALRVERGKGAVLSAGEALKGITVDTAEPKDLGDIRVQKAALNK